MKNKGFTLVELLVVILIIGLIATITIPIITNVVSSSRESACKRQEEMILDAAKRWASDNMSLINEDPFNLTIETLINDGYLTNKTLKNPRTNEDIDKDSSIEIHYNENYNQYEYTYNLCS